MTATRFEYWLTQALFAATVVLFVAGAWAGDPRLQKPVPFLAALYLVMVARKWRRYAKS